MLVLLVLLLLLLFGLSPYYMINRLGHSHL
jgi:hypothetical protein